MGDVGNILLITVLIVMTIAACLLAALLIMFMVIEAVDELRYRFRKHPRYHK